MRTDVRTATRTLAMAVLALLTASATSAQEYDPEARLRELGVELHTPGAPMANYVRAVRTGNLLFLAGHGPCKAGECITGKVGVVLSVEQGYEAARATAIDLLSTLKAELGDLRRVRRIVKVLGMVNTTPDFQQQPAVINGASDLFVAVFGDRGRHARSAVGMISLPQDIAVEIEMIVEIEPE